jgi:hypothetical protein
MTMRHHTSFAFLRLATALALVCLLPVCLGAQQEEHGAHAEPSGPPPHVPMPQGIETATADETEHGHWHTHHAGFFLGASTFKSDTGFTIGGDYEYRLTKYVGIGGQVEHAFGDLKETVVVFPVFFHPGAGLRFGVGPGFEKYAGELPSPTADDDPGEESHDKDFHFVWRMQILYDFPVTERISLTPSFAIDFQSGRQVYVYGVTLGYGF